MTSLLRPLTIAAALALSAGTAAAQGRGHGNGKGVHRGADDGHAVDARRAVPPGLAKQGGVPPGLAKKGGVPPGQARRAGRRVVPVGDGVAALRDAFGRRGYTVVRTAPAGAGRYVYYRDTDGAVRRAVVRQGDGRLAFGNVPAGIVSEVLARLY
jgi:hypothetical protein